MAAPSILMTAAEVALALRVPRSRVYREAANGKLRSVRKGRLLRFAREAVEERRATMLADPTDMGVPEIATAMRCGRRVVIALIHADAFPGTQFVDGQYRVPVRSYEAYVGTGVAQ